MAKRKKKSKRRQPSTPAPPAGEAQAPEPEAAAESRRVRTTPAQKLLLIAFGLALAVLLLLLLEGALALFGLGDRYRYEDPFVGFEPGNDLFTLRNALKRQPGGEAVYVTSPNKLAFFNHQEFPAEKAPGTYRVFAVGGSTTAGRPYDDRVAFARWMQLYLDAMDPTRRFEVVNAGAISYASYRIVVLMRELVRYEPDLFVVYTGHNEFLEERTYSDLIHEDPRRRRLRHWLGGLRSVTLARAGLRRLRPAAEPPGTLLASEVTTRLEGWTGIDAYHRDDDLRDSIVEHFAFNLRQMARIARDHGAEVIFIRPVSNLKDFSPFKSEPRVPFTPAQSETIAALLAAARQALEEGDTERDFELLTRLVELAPDYADFHFRLGQALFLRGEHEEAKRSFVRAKDLDVAPLRALESISDRVRDVAAESGLPLVDLPAILEDDSEARYGHRILGNEHLLDHVHPDIPVHSLIAERVIDVLSGMGVVRPDASWSEAKRQEIYDRLVGSIDRRYYAQRDLNLAKVLGWSGKLAEAEAPLVRAAEVLTDEPDVHLNLGILYQKTGRREAALQELDRAVELAPESPEAHFNLGVTHGLLGRLDDGIAALEEALRLRPEYVEARYNLAVLLRRRGDFNAALAALGKVLEDKPDAAEAHREIGLVHRRQGRWDDAEAAFRRALEIDPGDAVARTDLAITYGRQGRPEAAVEELERAIASDPAYAEAHYNLGVVQAQRGLTEEALAAYRKTVEFNPTHAEACNNLGILLAGRGELEAARRELERAVELRPDYAEAHLNLGVVYDQSGLPDEAMASVRRALELDPENPRFQQAMALLLEARRR